MAVAEEIETEPQKKKGGKGLIIGVVLALIMGGAGFYIGSSGMLSSGSSKDPSTSADISEKEMKPEDLPKLDFVEIEPVLIALARESERRHLRFRGHLEVAGDYKEDVEKLMPRILDVLNSYLRAVELKQLEDPAGLLRLRAQMLRRIQIVTGEGRVRDLLISEFVLN